MSTLAGVWVMLLQFNKHYSAYCQAREKSDLPTCTRLEAEFTSIARVYTDFGEVEHIETDEQFDAWYESHSQLFHDPVELVRWVPSPKHHEIQPGHIVLSIALADKAKVLAAVERYLRLIYEGLEFPNAPAFEEWQPEVQAMLVPLPKPAYRLHGEFNTANRSRLRKACYVFNIKGSQSISDTVLAIKRDAGNPFGWSLSEQEARDIERGVFKRAVNWQSEVTIVKRALKDFEAYVRNTVHGRFPDPS